MRSTRRTRSTRTATATAVAAAAAVLTLVPPAAAQAAAPAPVSAPAYATTSAPGGNAAILGIDYATRQRDVASVLDAARLAIESASPPRRPAPSG